MSCQCSENPLCKRERDIEKLVDFLFWGACLEPKVAAAREAFEKHVDDPTDLIEAGVVLMEAAVEHGIL